VNTRSLASRQSSTSHLTNQDVAQLLNYCHIHPEAKVCYHASNMILKIHSDAGYLNKFKVGSHTGSHFYFGSHDNKLKLHNGAILNPTGILRQVASAASEAKYGALFVHHHAKKPGHPTSHCHCYTQRHRQWYCQ
jgi:hypothetical protein